MMTIANMINECARCRACEGAAYQAAPAAYVGELDSPILVVAQNPGEIKSGDFLRKATARNVLLKTDRSSKDFDLTNLIKDWYWQDFTTSTGYAQMTKVFGDRWLERGFLYTNAVRCRTEGNKSPSAQMSEECWKYTRELIEDRKAVIMVGSVARRQIWKSTKIAKSKVFEQAGRLYLYIPHYVLWTAPKIEAYKYFVEEITDAL